jgi:hypothetical protein
MARFRRTSRTSLCSKDFVCRGMIIEGASEIAGRLLRRSTEEFKRRVFFVASLQFAGIY